ncbi:hypothetical protein KY330_05630 [Candidatus Woesearchaeota archaeon]|nr:hypothetical protein [Candidatus Woesearchaeota archaeon]
MVSTIAIGGMVTLGLLIITLIIGPLSMKGKIKNGIKWHKWLAGLTLLVGIIHALYGLGIL